MMGTSPARASRAAEGTPACGTGLDPAFLACVHCGLCTSACPTYLELGSEADSPRGRIHLMRAVAEGRLGWTAEVVRHIDLCLECRACETACPAGVNYHHLLEQARAELEERGLRPARYWRFLSLMRDHLFPYRTRLEMALAPLRLLRALERVAPRVTSLLPAFLRELAGLVPRLPPAFAWRRLPETSRARGPESLRVGLLAGCVQSVVYGPVNEATVRVLQRNGCTVQVPPRQGCCGALHQHTGAREQAMAMARRNVDAFEAAGVDVIVTNAAGCGSTLKEYGELLAGDPVYSERAAAFSRKVRDVSELLAELPLRPPTGALAARVVYHDPCHLAHGQGVREQPRRLLAAIPGVTLVELPEAEICCGSAGIYNLTEPDMARRLQRRKVEHLAATGAQILATGNPGCMMQLDQGIRHAGLPIRVCHPVELLDEAYRAADTLSLSPEVHLSNRPS